MTRAIVVAVGDLDSLPREVQDVANVLSSAGWTVRLCIGDDASRAGLARAASEGPARLAWIGAHSDAAGFALADGVLPAHDLGLWLAQIEAEELVLNTCYSLAHVTSIQRVAGVGVGCTVDPAGVGDELAWVTGVAIARSRVLLGDLAAAVREATGDGVVQYRYIPHGGMGAGRRRQMPADEIREQLAVLVRAINGEAGSGADGLIARVGRLSEQMTAIDRRLAALEQQIERQPMALPERSMYATIAMVAVAFVLLLALLLRLGGGI